MTTRSAGADTLTEPLALRDRRPSEVPLLRHLQPNILRPHVRDSLRLLVFQVDHRERTRASLAAIARDRSLMKSAADHFDEVDAHRSGGGDAGAFIGVAISRSGYERLGVPEPLWPPDTAFRAGMGARGPVLGDPGRDGWDYTGRIDGMFVVGSHSQTVTDEHVARLRARLEGVTVLAEEKGATLRNKLGEPIEHFGYVDGRSQPLFVEEDAERERALTDGISVWNPLVALDRVLVPDPGAAEPSSYGSYLVYRKLEQDVRAFEAKERLVEQTLALREDDRERAGALLVGRFEDGTPVALQSSGHDLTPVLNNFTYADDPRGSKCPVFGHIRALNDRRGSARDRLVIARRGQTYGARPDLAGRGAARPAGGVGLLFMAAVADVEGQFEHLQRLANGNGHSPPDPVIGQPSGGEAEPRLPPVWGEDERIACPGAVTRAVTMRGGEYLFLPSIPFLRALDA